MRSSFARLCALGAVLGSLLGFAGSVHAQSYPVKPVRMVVPFPPGGAVDLIARLIQPRMSDVLGQPVLVENRGGAAGNLGTEQVAKGPHDGYNLLINTNGQAISLAMHSKLGWSAADFIPLTQLVTSHLILIASPKFPANSLPEFIALAKARPGVLNYGGTGIGNPLHLTMEWLKLLAGIDVVAVHYQGDAPLYTAMMAGQVDVAVTPFSTALPFVKSGKLRALAVPTAGRVPLVPDVPTVAETLPGLVSPGWQGLFLPSHSPAESVEALQRAAVRALAAPEVRERLQSLSYETVGSSPDQFKPVFEAEVARYVRIVKDARIPLQD